MRRRYIDRQFVELTEEEAVCETRSVFGANDFRITFVLDTWLKMQYFAGEREPGTTDKGCFQSYAYFQCLQSPYTLMTAHDLWRRAYYIEAAILLRHLLEVFVQLRYFQRHPELCVNHVTEKPKGRVRFNSMFDDIAPGSYEGAYHALSIIAHGNMNYGFRGDIPAAKAGAGEYIVPIVLGAKFKRESAQLVYAFYIIIMTAFVNHYQQFFPKNTFASDAELVEDVAEAQKWLTSVFEDIRNKVIDPSLFDTLRPLAF